MHDVSSDHLRQAVSDDVRREPPADREREAEPRSQAKTRRGWGGRLFALAAFLLLVGALAYGGWHAYLQHEQVMATATQQSNFVPEVRVAPVKPASDIMTVSLPATTAAFADASIYARATGYIAKRNVDIGDHVKQGELLAQLAVPELDHQISQNEATLKQLRAALQQAEANRELAQVTWDRDRPLVGQGWASKQQGTVDVQTLRGQQAAVSVAQANVAAQENLLKVLNQQRDYASVQAPFDGVITQRNVDVGSLVQGNVNSGTFMFEIMQSDVIRVWVYVPQNAVFGVTAGVDTSVRIPEIPDRTFPAKVTRIADALQPGTRTLLTEIDVKNPDGTLAPGMYVTVDLHIPRKTPAVVVSADAIIFNSGGVQVAVVEDGVAHLRKIEIARDFGREVEVSSGVKGGEQVILNPPADLTDGAKVRIRAEQKPQVS
jgi:RND family efflux transporter MFP subunit